MRLPLQITFRHVDASPGVEDRIGECAGELDRFFDQIMSCRVAVERQHRRQHQGNLFRVRLDITVPGREIVVGRDSKPGRAHHDISVAIRDAFDAARRQIEDHARIYRGEVKLHTVPDHGRIARLFPKENCGFIATVNSGEVYFHRNSVAGGAFDKLVVGDEVRFVAQHSESAKGLQASTVSPIGRHNLPSAETVCGWDCGIPEEVGPRGTEGSGPVPSADESVVGEEFSVVTSPSHEGEITRGS